MPIYCVYCGRAVTNLLKVKVGSATAHLKCVPQDNPKPTSIEFFKRFFKNRFSEIVDDFRTFKEEVSKRAVGKRLKDIYPEFSPAMIGLFVEYLYENPEVLENIELPQFRPGVRVVFCTAGKLREGTIMMGPDSNNYFRVKTDDGKVFRVHKDNLQVPSESNPDEPSESNPDDAKSLMKGELEASEEYLEVADAIRRQFPIESKLFEQMAKDELKHYKIIKHLAEKGVVSNPMSELIKSEEEFNICLKKMNPYDRERMMDNITADIVGKIPIYGNVAHLRKTLGIAKGPGKPKIAFIYASKDRNIVKPMINTVFFFANKFDAKENKMEDISKIWDKYGGIYVDEMLKSAYPEKVMVTPSTELKFKHREMKWEELPTDIQSDFILWAGYKGYRTQINGAINMENPSGQEIPRRLRYYTTKRGRYIWADIEPVKNFDRDSFRVKKIMKGRKVVTRLIVGCPKGKFRAGRCKVGTRVQAELLEDTPENRLKARIRMTPQFISLYKKYSKRYSPAYAMRKAWTEFKEKYTVEPLVENARVRYYLKPLSRQELARLKRFDNLWYKLTGMRENQFGSVIPLAKQLAGVAAEEWAKIPKEEKDKYMAMATKLLPQLKKNPEFVKNQVLEIVKAARGIEKQTGLPITIIGQTEAAIKAGKALAQKQPPSKGRERALKMYETMEKGMEKVSRILNPTTIKFETPRYATHGYPVTEQEVRDVLKLFRPEHWIPDIIFTSPGRYQRGTLGQYVRSKKVIKIFSVPMKKLRGGTFYQYGKNDWLTADDMKKVLLYSILPHEIGHAQAFRWFPLADQRKHELFACTFEKSFRKTYGLHTPRQPYSTVSVFGYPMPAEGRRAKGHAWPRGGVKSNGITPEEELRIGTATLAGFMDADAWNYLTKNERKELMKRAGVNIIDRMVYAGKSWEDIPITSGIHSKIQYYIRSGRLRSNGIELREWLWNGMEAMRRLQVLRTIPYSSRYSDAQLRALANKSWKALPSDIRNSLRFPTPPMPLANPLSKKDKIATMTVKCGGYVVLDPRWKDWSGATDPFEALIEYVDLCESKKRQPLPVRAGSETVRKVTSDPYLYRLLTRRWRQWLRGRIFTPKSVK